jgi:pimeloyl-ACP methyl ester carboxylesterase
MGLTILYLHGFGDCQPQRCPIAASLRQVLPDSRMYTPCYHPIGRIEATRIKQFLAELQNLIDEIGPAKVHLIGYSFGGLLAAILACQRPERIGNVLLLAPAIDNYERNYEARTPEEWLMPPEFVEELLSYPTRPAIVRPTILVHGSLDRDEEGSAPWRIQRWAEEQPFRGVYILDQVDHSLATWLSDSGNHSAALPAFRQVVQQWIEL